MNASKTASSADTGRDVIVTRVVDAAPDAVFRAFTDRERVGKWWGPRGFSTTISEMDVRPGGVWRFVMHGPDGKDYPNVVTYREIVPGERLVFDHGDEGKPGYHRNTVTFVKEGGKTRVTLHLVFSTAEERDRIVKLHNAIEGGNETLARLSEHLSNNGPRFTLTRTFDAPRALVYKAWTEPERLARWWGPKGLELGVAKLEVRPGGTFLYSMKAPDGHVNWGKFVYREIVPPEKLVFVVSFADEQGNPQRPPMAPTWPVEMLTSVEFAEREGKTTISMWSEPVEANEIERATFEKGFGSMKGGFGGTFDQLEAYLRSA